MNNIKTAKLLYLNDVNEEDATLLIDGHSVECFINSCPYEIEIGKTYEVELTLNLSEFYTIEKTSSNSVLIEKIPKGYAYFLYGTLKDDSLETFTTFHDEDIHYDHPDLNNQFIKLKVDRINVNFLQ
ncbi:hypothetical protein [Pseudomonas sp. CLCA07]